MHEVTDTTVVRETSAGETGADESTIRLTQYSHGGGCGCKIAPGVLSALLRPGIALPSFPDLVVGNDSRDDAAVFDAGHGEGVISTTDFFMPVVDDPVTFGEIAAANAISDVYAMGGTPLMSVAILGWPVNKIPVTVAAKVIDGGRMACAGAGIPLAGGHSIDCPEPVFGLAVTGRVKLSALKRNNTARAGDLLFLTKPLGVGILTTAQKQQKLRPEHADIAPDLMKTLNKAGARFATLDGVHAMTDVTGFGLAGHLLEMCEGSGLRACIDGAAVPVLAVADTYAREGCVPGGTTRNYESYREKLPALTARQKALFCDPQTSGGLLVAVAPGAEADFLAASREAGLSLQSFGCFEDNAGPGCPEGGSIISFR